MDSIVRALPFDPARITGLSPRLLESHHANNYAGAVRRRNAIQKELQRLDFATAPGFVVNGLKREELVATNSMVLHELYFASLGDDGHAMAPAMELALAANFGTAARWRNEFVAMGKALGGGSGWVVLAFQPRDGTLVNQWAADHTHALAGGVPLLALDMYEHAYHMDFGADAARYVDVFMANVRWEGVYERYQEAVTAASESLAAEPEALADALVLDVRRAGVFAEATAMVSGARWCDPAHVDAWGRELPGERRVVVYCVYGHEVGRATAMRLHAMGVDAHFLRGGFQDWQASGRAMQAVDRDR